MKNTPIVLSSIVTALVISIVYWIIVSFSFAGSRDADRRQADLIDKAFRDFLNPIVENSMALVKEERLFSWLEKEKTGTGDLKTIRAFLDIQKQYYGFDGVDLASAATEIVYQDEGSTVQMSPKAERDNWYYGFAESDEKMNYELYYDSNTGVLYIYHNRKIFSPAQEYLGVMGIRIRYNYLTRLLISGDKYGLEAYFTDRSGEILIHPDQRKIGRLDIYDFFGLLQKIEDFEQPLEEQLVAGKAEGYRYSYTNFPGYLNVKNKETSNLINRLSLTRLILINILLILLIGGIHMTAFRFLRRRPGEIRA